MSCPNAAPERKPGPPDPTSLVAHGPGLLWFAPVPAFCPVREKHEAPMKLQGHGNEGHGLGHQGAPRNGVKRVPGKVSSESEDSRGYRQAQAEQASLGRPG